MSGTLAVAFLGYYLAVAPRAGAGAAAPAGLVVLAIGYLWGMWPGLAVGAATMPVLWALRPVTGVMQISAASDVFYFLLMSAMGLVGGIAGRVQGGAEAARVEADRLAERLNRAQEIARLGYWSLAPDGRLEWSDVLWKTHGFTEAPDDVERVFAHIHADDEPRVRAHIDALWKEGGHAEGEYRVVVPDSAGRWIAYTGDAEVDAGGVVVRVFGTGQDITERKRHEAALEHFKELLDRLEEMYWVGDPAANRFEFSAAAQAMYGRSAHELSVEPQAMGEIVDAEDLPGVYASIAEAVAGRPAETEFRIHRPDGETRWIRSRAWPIPDGSWNTAYGIMTDITDAKAVETMHHRLEEQNADITQLLDSLEDSYWTVDLRTDTGTFSKGTETIYGRHVSEFEEDLDLWSNVIVEEDRERVMDQISEVYRGKHVTLRYRIKRRNGSVRWVESTAWPRQEAGETVAIVGIVHDITPEHDLAQARREAKKSLDEVDRLQELDKMKALFLNTAAHELANLMTPLKIQARLLGSQHADYKQTPIIERTVHRLEVLVEDLLDAARLQDRRLKFRMDETDATQLLEDIGAGIAPHAEEQTLGWKVSIGSELMVHGDGVRLTQAVTNLLNNAVKFTPEGGQVTLHAERKGKKIVIQVADTGLGMTPDQLEGLFQPFNQFHRGQTGTHIGTGLGLYISKGIIDEHEGTLRAESAGPGQGTTFTIELPAYDRS